jgi:hypothetical protein
MLNRQNATLEPAKNGLTNREHYTKNNMNRKILIAISLIGLSAGMANAQTSGMPLNA